jgi:hypothetical protein
MLVGRVRRGGNGAQERIDRLQIVIRHVPVVGPEHHRQKVAPVFALASPGPPRCP